MAKDEITLDDLARMIQKGFLELKQQNSETHTKLNAHIEESRKAHIATNFKLSETVTRVEHNQLKLRVDTLETQTT